MQRQLQPIRKMRGKTPRESCEQRLFARPAPRSPGGGHREVACGQRRVTLERRLLWERRCPQSPHSAILWESRLLPDLSLRREALQQAKNPSESLVNPGRGETGDASAGGGPPRARSTRGGWRNESGGDGGGGGTGETRDGLLRTFDPEPLL